VRALLAGGRNLAYHLGRALTARGYRVTAINRDPADCDWLAARLRGTVVRGDAADPAILEDAGAARSHLLVALTGHDPDNLVVCQLARQLFGVPRVVSLVNDPANVELFIRLGVTDVVSFTQALAVMIEQQADFESIVSRLPLGRTDVVLSELSVTASSPCRGRALRDLPLPAGSIVGCVVRAGRSVIARGDFIFETGDRVLLLATPDSLGAASRQITGEDA
jgi:trk system potassium uptake protein TrkA